MTKYLLCPDKFKGSMTAVEVCDSLREGIMSADDSAVIVLQPLADGGDGSLDLLEESWGLERVRVSSVDPLFRPIETFYLRNAKQAFIELASTAGLILLDESERNPMNTSTYGCGEVIRRALEDGCSDVRLFIGGSATNDCAMGIAAALGYRFYDKSGDMLQPIGSSLGRVERIEFEGQSDLFEQVSFSVVCDVSNPLAGPDGAAYVYARQKGANDEMIATLDSGLVHFAGKLKTQGYTDVLGLRGAGAAGGVGGGMVALMEAELISGIEMFFDLFGVHSKIHEADVVITGEGSFDDQSFQGKVAGKVCEVCANESKVCHVVCGVDMRSHDRDIPRGLGEVYPISALAMSIEDSKANAAKYITKAGELIARDALKRRDE